MKPQITILYPFYLECSYTITDTYWKSIFEYLAYGKAPSYGFNISETCVSSYLKNREFKYTFSPDSSNIPTIVKDIIHYFKYAGFFSDYDKYNIQIKSLVDLSWSVIKKSSLKSFLIEHYILKNLNLTLSQSKYLNSIMTLLFLFKIITLNDIDYHHGKIHSIQGFDTIISTIRQNKSIIPILI